MARTGSGKTAAFGIPILEHMIQQPPVVGNSRPIRVVVLSPTRELSVQTIKVIQILLSVHNQCMSEEDPGYRPLACIGLHGTESLERQFERLALQPDIICATPGRLAHLVAEIPDFTLRDVRHCVLDEADRLLELGLAADVRQILRSIHGADDGGSSANSSAVCQCVITSATLPQRLVDFTRNGVFRVDSAAPTIVRLDSEATVSAELRLGFVTCRSLEKDAALLYFLSTVLEEELNDKKKKPREKEANSMTTGRTLIFAATRHHVEYLTTLLTSSGFSATYIYGTLDQEARTANLSAFRKGAVPIMVVTDVAARGIDVPLLDHVVHYHVPPSAKLFVHRSGRAARAGRIGYAWSLVEPEELPYMLDLLVFLGHRPATSETPDETHDETVPRRDPPLSYTVKEMDPTMVHYGSIPEGAMTMTVEAVQRIQNSELSSSQDAQAIKSLTRTCRNAIQQYRRTRPEASKDGVRRAKAILEQSRIPSHPLFVRVANENADETEIKQQKLMQQRYEFLEALSKVRPKETVFETVSRKINANGVVSQVDRGRTTSKQIQQDAAILAMRNMRRQVRMTQDKANWVVAGTMANDEDEHHEEVEESDEFVEPINKPFRRQTTPEVVSKRRLSKAERKRLKKNPQAVATSSYQSKLQSSSEEKAVKRDFRDPTFYMSNDQYDDSTSTAADRSRMIEAAMQNSASGPQNAAVRLEQAVMDVYGDETDDLVKHQRLKRWDASKRKYVTTTVGQELNNKDSKTKKQRLESGQLVKRDKLKLGDVYAKWQKKTNQSVGRQGVFDDAVAPSTNSDCGVNGRRGKKTGDKGEARVPDDTKLKSTSAIQKERARQANLRVKNMRKPDRRRLEQQQREHKNYMERKQANRAIPKKRKN